ncbi:hypothetical protein AGLY_001637, partial [Aphis glycines]
NYVKTVIINLLINYRHTFYVKKKPQDKYTLDNGQAGHGWIIFYLLKQGWGGKNILSRVNPYEDIREQVVMKRGYNEYLQCTYDRIKWESLCCILGVAWFTIIYRDIKFESNKRYNSIRKTILNGDDLINFFLIGQHSSSLIIIVSQTYGKSCIQFSTLSYLYKHFYELNLQNNLQRLTYEELSKKILSIYHPKISTLQKRDTSWKNRKFQLSINSLKELKI